jgi:hypothetical protein
MDGPAPGSETGGAMAAGQGLGSQAPNVIAEGVPPERRIGDHSEPDATGWLQSRPLRQAGSGRATERLPAACTGARSA